MRRALVLALVRGAAIAATCAAGCAAPPVVDPLQLERNLLTVNNRTAEDWTDVEVWINRQFRVTVPKIAAGGRFQAPLDVFVTGYGQRFNFARMQMNDLRLTAKTPVGKSFELRKQFETNGLADALKGLGGKR